MTPVRERSGCASVENVEVIVLERRMPNWTFGRFLGTADRAELARFALELTLLPLHPGYLIT